MAVDSGTFHRFLKLKNRQNARKLRSLMKPFIRFLEESKNKKLEEFDAYDVLEYLEEGKYRNFVKSDELKASTIKQIYDACVNFMNWYLDEPAEDFQEFQERRSRLRRLKNDVKKKIKPEPRDITERKWLKLEELEDLLLIARDEEESERDFNIIYLFAYFGLRRKELFDPENDLWREVDLDRNYLRLIREKSKQVCILYYDDRTREILKRSLDNGVLDREWKNYEYKKYKRLFDHVDFVPHSLRYTFNHHQKQVISKLLLGGEIDQDSEVLENSICGWKIGQKMSEYYDSATKGAIRRIMKDEHYFNQLEF